MPYAPASRRAPSRGRRRSGRWRSLPSWTRTGGGRTRGAGAAPARAGGGGPKVGAMEIIAELETDRRGPYAGAVGYLDFAGGMDTAIALRTMVVKDGVASMQAGGGIVADSTPDGEYAESHHKMRGSMRAIRSEER